MKYFGFPLPVALAALALGAGLGCVLRRKRPGRVNFRKFGPGDSFKAVLLTAAAIATGGILGYTLLRKLAEPVNISVFAIACWAFGEIYYRIFLKMFHR